MSIRLQRTAQLLAALVLALTVMGIRQPLVAHVQAAAPASTSFTNGQNATLVVGQPDFTTNTIANPPAANRFNGPNDLAVDVTTGKVFLADTGNHRVLRFASFKALARGSAAEGVLGQADFISKVYAATQSGMDAPLSLAIDNAGRLYVADYGNQRVLRFDNAASKANGANADGVLGQVDFTSATRAAGASGMSQPFGLAVDTTGHLWVADENNNRVLRFDNAASKANGANADGVLGQPTFASNGASGGMSGMQNPLSVTMDNAGHLWVADSRNFRILRFDDAANKANGANADALLGNGSGTSQNKMRNIFDVQIDTTGRLWVADTYNHRVLWFDNVLTKSAGSNADGVLGQTNFTNMGNSTTQNTMFYPQGVILDSKNQPWVMDTYNMRALYFGPPLSTNADLSALLPSSGTLSPAFAPATTSYTASVANGVSSLTVIPTAADPGATLTVNSVAVASGSASGALPLTVGTNTITTTVTAEDGVTTKTYRLTITRAVPPLSTNADLSALLPSSGTLSPAFAPATTSYTVSVANGVSSLTVIPTAADLGATLTVNGVAVASGSASGAIPLTVGPNTITTIVTAEDGVTTKTYRLTINRAIRYTAYMPMITINT